MGRETFFGQALVEQRKDFLEAGDPVVSVDTKKKELIGNFKNAGRTWRKTPDEVNAHDFPSDAECRAVPYGIYDLAANCGFVNLDAGRNGARHAGGLKNQRQHPEDLPQGALSSGNQQPRSQE